MTAVIPYHAGILVPDIHKAIEAFGASLGYTFNEPMPVRPNVEDRISGTTGPVEILVSYTRESPFRLELIEQSGEGIFGSRHGEGLHHLGIWEPDVEGRLAELEAAGHPIDAVIRSDDGSISVFYAAPLPGQGGTRIEYVGEHQRARLERWFNTGVLA
jgi:catechol 2,3-dioxygenase-like lactoylglutathione lyase family enzyme